MAFDYINEAFKKLEVLTEEMFDTSTDGINNLTNFMDNSETITYVIDTDAETPDDVKDSYIGKVIVNCNICHSHIFEDKAAIVLDETTGFANIDEQCPYCGETEGFKVVGEIAPFNADSAVETDESTDVIEDKPEEVTTDTVDEAEETLDESKTCSRATAHAQETLDKEELTEDFKEVSITTDDQHLEMTSDETGKVTVTTEPVQTESVETEGEIIVPVTADTEQEILDNNAVEEPVEEETVSEEESVEDDTDDIMFDDIDEDSFDELGEAYLRQVYENVKSFKTTSAAKNDKALVLEGLITFDSGVTKTTGFIFEAKDVNARGQLRFSGSNKHFAESAGAYSLVGRVLENKLMLESLKYNYTVNEETVRGRVCRK